jgi:hypothetical protein
MKSIVLIPIEREEKKDSNRRAEQRRMAVPRRVKPERRGNERLPPVPKEISDRRVPRQRRRLPDRRLGLKIDLKDLE